MATDHVDNPNFVLPSAVEGAFGVVKQALHAILLAALQQPWFKSQQQRAMTFHTPGQTKGGRGSYVLADTSMTLVLSLHVHLTVYSASACWRQNLGRTLSVSI